MRPLPPPVAGVPFDVETAASRVSAYELGEGRTVLLLHSFNAAGSGIELAPLASRLAEHRRVVLVDWLGFGTSDRPDAPYGWALYGDQFESIRLAALQPGETSVDVVALSLPGQYVVVAAAEHPERFGRIVLISPTGLAVSRATLGVPPGTSTGSCAGRGSVGCCSRSSLGARSSAGSSGRPSPIRSRSRPSTRGTAGGPASSRTPTALR